jgi:hypothetical protein
MNREVPVKYLYGLACAMAVTLGSIVAVGAGTNANTWHNLPASNPANDGTSCGETGGTPNDTNCASANIHDVHDVDAAGYVQANGEPPACEFHGGFQGVKRNC